MIGWLLTADLLLWEGDAVAGTAHEVLGNLQQLRVERGRQQHRLHRLGELAGG
jgi:hypothetical protein